MYKSDWKWSKLNPKTLWIKLVFEKHEQWNKGTNRKETNPTDIFEKMILISQAESSHYLIFYYQVIR